MPDKAMYKDLISLLAKYYDDMENEKLSAIEVEVAIHCKYHINSAHFDRALKLAKERKNKKVDEDLTNLPPIPDKVKKKLGSPIPRSKEEKEREMEQPGTFQRWDVGQRFNKISESKMSIVEKIIKEEIDRLLEEKSFRVKLHKKIRENKLCEKCQMPMNACRCTENSTSFGPKTMLDREIEKPNFKIREVAIVKDKNEKHIIMKDSLGGISCDCEHYLKEHINGYCKHIKKYLIESPVYNDDEFKAEEEGKSTFFFDKKTNKPVAFYNQRDNTIKKYPETNQELYDGQKFTIYAQRDRRLQASLVKFLNMLKGKQ